MMTNEQYGKVMERLGSIDAKLEFIPEIKQTVSVLDTRIEILERGKAWIQGGFALLGFLASFFFVWAKTWFTNGQQ